MTLCPVSTRYNVRESANSLLSDAQLGIRTIAIAAISADLSPFPKTATGSDDVQIYWGSNLTRSSRQVAGSYWPTAAQINGTIAGWIDHELLGLAFW